MDDIETQTEDQFLDALYRNLTALREVLMITEQHTPDHQTRQQLTVKRRALEADIYDIERRRRYLDKKG
ncbi:hypothetical protein [Endozoicomonas ascidiicola]|uniref:hypothetical protein n=1 Tax=Endozoicomonas ascidiicola TaxID=1698521 RepID=UPI0008337F64|nr:hypothetical protein [Endozoicomonas ascidiicola]